MAPSRMAGRQSSAAPDADTTRAERTNSIPSMPVKASATVPVSRPLLSFSNQHNTKRNRFSGRGDLALKAFSDGQPRSLRRRQELRKDPQEPSRAHRHEDAADPASQNR